eukprot:scaffold40234_cov68-Phaeocystis_antarctica.AAC.3
MLLARQPLDARAMRRDEEADDWTHQGTGGREPYRYAEHACRGAQARGCVAGEVGKLSRDSVTDGHHVQRQHRGERADRGRVVCGHLLPQQLA